jgi:hypothetical protein
MNVEAIERAENFARNVLKLYPEARDEYFKMLPGLGLTEEEVKNLQEYVCLYHMFTDPSYYKKIQYAVGEMLYETFNIK